MSMFYPGALECDWNHALEQFEDQGYVHLGRIASDDTLAQLRQRADAIMLGEVKIEGLFFQADTTTGAYGDLTYGKGWEGPSLNYRKIEKLERDPLFRAWLENPLFERIVRSRIATDEVTIYRALLMTKSAIGGTYLPWHQDAGLFWGLSKDPEIQLWTTLDDAPLDGGCVEVVPGSHKWGLVTPTGGVVPANVVERAEAEAKAVPLPAKAGDVVAIHNLLWHRSGVNRTGKTRRAFTVCYMSSDTRCLRKKREPRVFPRVFSSNGHSLSVRA